VEVARVTMGQIGDRDPDAEDRRGEAGNQEARRVRVGQSDRRDLNGSGVGVKAGAGDDAGLLSGPVIGQVGIEEFGDDDGSISQGTWEGGAHEQSDGSTGASGDGTEVAG